MAVAPWGNADIINKGVVTGDVGEIVRIGLVMLAVTLVLGIISIITVYFSARTAMAFGRDVRGALLRGPGSRRSRCVNWTTSAHPR